MLEQTIELSMHQNVFDESSQVITVNLTPMFLHFRNISWYQKITATCLFCLNGSGLTDRETMDTFNH